MVPWEKCHNVRRKSPRLKLYREGTEKTRRHRIRFFNRGQGRPLAAIGMIKSRLLNRPQKLGSERKRGPKLE